MSACAAQSPPAKVDRKAAEFGFERETLDTGMFRHVIYREKPVERSDVLHIYLDGDGLPFIDRETISKDPTPATPVMLELMSLDPAPSVYLGRPCYFGMFAESPCNAFYWTNGRYSEAVVASLVMAIRKMSVEYGASKLRIFGHSGGGSLAMLAGNRIDRVTTIVTIGANLDIDAWAAHHDYTPLVGSLNPVDLHSRPGVRFLHLVGTDDSIATPALALDAGKALSQEVRVVPGTGHACCWTQTWTDILGELSAASSGTASDSVTQK